MALGFLVCIMLAIRRAKTLQISPNHILDLSLYIVISGIVGARLLYILMNFSYYFKHPIEIFLLQKGGLSYYGGFLLALIVGFLVARKRRLPLAKIADLIALYLPLGHAISRIGCYLNGCCYGKPTEMICAVQFPSYSLAAHHFGSNHFIHPVQLYSVLMNLFIFIILNLYKKQFEGELIFDYMILYGIGRFILEIFRADTPVVFLGLSAFQFISLGLILSGLIIRYIIGKPRTNK